jgi:type II secretion system protein L
MTTLRVLLDAPPEADRADAWALYDNAGRLVRAGHDRPAAWPAAENVEAIVAASRTRLISVLLPPLPSRSLPAAIGFALEDQFAGPPEGQHVAVSPQQPNGRVLVAVVAKALIAGLAEGRAGNRFGRIIAEPELAPSSAGWRWCAEDNRAFVRARDGSSFAVDPPKSGAALPSELALAIAGSPVAAEPPTEVRVNAADVADADLARWRQDSGLAFVLDVPWRWRDAPASAFAGATELLQGAFATAPREPQGAHRRLFRPASILVAAALTLHVVATAGEWAWLKIDAWRRASEWSTLAAAAGIPAELAGSGTEARAALARRYADLRHGQGLPAPEDALPLAARAAPALAALPAGSVRAATYADGHWTLELTRVNEATLREFDIRMRASGLAMLSATTPAGTRARFGTL